MYTKVSLSSTEIRYAISTDPSTVPTMMASV